MRNGFLVPRKDDFFYPLESCFNRFWDEFFQDNPLQSIKGTGTFPRINAYEDNGELVITASVSGMSKDDINVEVTEDNVLVISGRMAKEYRYPDKVAKGYFQEVRSSAFQRSFQLPENVEGSPTAALKDGML